MKNINRIRKIYKDYDKSLKPFKNEMVKRMKNNKALAFAICETYRATTYKSQYWEIISYFASNYPEAYLNLCKTYLLEKGLCGRDGFWLTLRFCGSEDIYEKYKKNIPESKAFGLVFGQAINIINENCI